MNDNATLFDTIKTRWDSLPSGLRGVFLQNSFSTHISEIASYNKLNEEQRKNLELEIILVIFLYEPLSRLKDNLIEVLGISEEIATALLFEIETTLLYGSIETLKEIERAPDFVGVRKFNAAREKSSLPEANTGLKERLELRPEGFAEDADREDPKEEVVKPLTREELLSALSAKRTMASDIEAVRQKGGTNRAE